MIQGYRYPTKPDDPYMNSWFFCACGAKNYTKEHSMSYTGHSKCWHCKTVFNTDLCRSYNSKYGDSCFIWRYYSTTCWYIWRFIARIHKHLRPKPRNIFYLKAKTWGEV